MELWKEVAMALYRARSAPHQPEVLKTEAEGNAFIGGIDDAMVEIGNVFMHSAGSAGFDIDVFETIATMGRE